MTTTTNTEFRREDLPKWARNSEAIFWVAKWNLSFRADVYRAQEHQYRRFLRRLAIKLQQSA